MVRQMSAATEVWMALLRLSHENKSTARLTGFTQPRFDTVGYLLVKKKEGN